MITKFSALYAGGVDMENVGLDGTPCNDRSFSDEYLATPLQKTERMANLWTGWGMTPYGWRNTISNRKATSVSLTYCSSLFTWPHHRASQLRLRLQHLPHVAPVAPGRRLRHGRHSDRAGSFSE